MVSTSHVANACAAVAPDGVNIELTIAEIVFTDAETAWFDYTIDAPTGTFGQPSPGEWLLRR